MDTYQGPNSGLRIIEIGGTIAGAFTAKLFSDLGADILKIEPIEGDRTRFLPPLRVLQDGTTVSGMHLFLNARKRSLTLDLTRPSGRAIVQALLAESDAVIDSRPFEPVEDDALVAFRKEPNAKHIVWLRITPFGLTGPWREWRGEDLVFQALAGGMYGWGSDKDAPLRAPGDSAEFLTGAFAAAMLSGPLLVHRPTREGQLIDVSQAGSQLLTATLDLTRFSFTGAVSHRIELPFPGIMQCKDGYVGINLLTDENWRQLCKMVERTDLFDDPRFATPGTRIQHADALFEIFDPLVRARTKEEFFEVGNRINQIPISPVADPKDVLESPHLAARGYFQAQELPDGTSALIPGPYIRMSDAEFAPITKAPLLGEHTASILEALGLATDVTQELAREEVI